MAAFDPSAAPQQVQRFLNNATVTLEETFKCLQSSRQVLGCPDNWNAQAEPEDGRARGTAQKPHGALHHLSRAAKYMDDMCCAVVKLGSRAGEALRDERFRTALLQLLAILVRLDHLLLPPSVKVARTTAHSFEQQQLPTEGRAGEHPQASQGAGPAPEGAMRCARNLYNLSTALLLAVSTPLRDPDAGSGTAAGVGCGSSESPGPAADTASATHQLVLGLELGCALLRMHTLQCCGRQVAAVCAWMGADGEEQEGKPEHEQQQVQQQQQQQAPGEQQSCTGPREQPRKQHSEVDKTLDTVSAVVDLIFGLMSLARAALTVLQGDGPPSASLAAEAAAAAAQHAGCRRLSRRFLLLLASNLRDSHLLEHCARAAVVATVWQQRCRPGSSSSSSACREAADEQGQGQGQGQGYGKRAAGQEAGGRGSHPQGLLGLLKHLVLATGKVEHLLPSCERAPAPASTVVGPAVRQALTGPGVVHLASILGLRALCTADGGPEYGMPVPYRALPAEYERWQGGCQVPYSREQHVLLMTGVLGNTPPPADLAQARGDVRGRLVLLLRACDVAVASAVGHGGGRGGQEGEQRVGGGVSGGRAGDGLRHALAPEVLMHVCFGALRAGSKLLDVCWEMVERAGAPRPSGGGPMQAGADGAGAGSAGEALSGVGAALALSRPGQVAGAAAGGAPGTAAAAADGPSAGSSRQLAVEQPPAGRRKALSLAALRAHEVRWWRRVCAAVTHVLPVAWRLPSYRLEVAWAQEFALAGWLGLEKIELPDPAKGSLPPAPPPRLAAALDGGLLPCLEGVLRRAAINPNNPTVSFVELLVKFSCSAHYRGHCFLPLLAYGEVEQSAGLLSALRCLMHLPGCVGGSGGDSGGGGSSGGSGGSGGGGSGGSSSGSTGQQFGAMMEQYAAGVASRLLVSAAPGPNTGATLGLGNSSSGGGSGCSSGGCDPVPAAPSTLGLSPAQSPLPPPTGLPRLHHMLAHAVQLLLPPLSRFLCRHATAGASEEQSQSLPEMVGADAAAVLRLVTVLPVLQMKRSGDKGCGSSDSSSNGSGSGDGSGAGSSNGGGGGSGSGSGGSAETQSDASPLARFLFDEVGLVELLAAVQRLVPRLSDTSTLRIASTVSGRHAEALCCVAAAFPDQVRELVTEPTGSSSGGGGAAAVWRTGPLRRAVSELRRKGREDVAEAVGALIGLVEAWRAGGGAHRAGGGGVGKGRVVAEAEAEAAGELAALRAAVERLRLAMECVHGMARAMLEVLSLPAALPV